MNITPMRFAIPVGFAIFAMFFGAGNLIFPLWLGVHASLLPWTMVGFLLTGVGVPLLGLFAVILYEGDYWQFFASLGRVPAHIVVATLVLLLGVATANPRCSLITYQTLAPYLPHLAGGHVLFNLIFFALVYGVSISKHRILDWIGYIFSPVKLGLLLTLIIAAVLTGHHHIPTVANASAVNACWHAMSVGYGTMDLLAAFFFCVLVYRHIATKVHAHPYLDEQAQWRVTLYACLMGAFLLSLVYMGFIMAAHAFASKLQSLSADHLISAMAILVFGKQAAFFICAMVSFACFVTSVSLTAIVVEYIHQQWLAAYAGYHQVLILTLMSVFAVSNMGFSTIMHYSIPVLAVLYPALMIFTVCRIINVFYNVRLSAFSFYVMILGSVCLNLKVVF